ncbi:MAG: DUF5698 domain-containing protein [Chloroflexota bacterium]|nr:DUF5698 domain-containing protein [Chloroflexota bacterium]
MQFTLSMQAILTALFIFGLRVTDMSLGTLRILFVMRGRKPIAWLFGFFQSVVYVIAITSVISDLNNLLNFIGYAAGCATGIVVGMFIEERLAIGYINLQIVSPSRGTAIVEHLRKEGYAVTEVPARGKDGMVTMLNCNVRRKQVMDIHKLVYKIDDAAFITEVDVRSVRRGFWRA